MGYLMELSRCKIFEEFSKEDQLKYFSLKKHKVLHDIDTFYYSVSINEELHHKQIEKMITIFQENKDILSTNRNHDFEICDLKLMPFSFSIYNYCFRLAEMYDIFLSSYIPNQNTPRIVIQLRSNGLWLEGCNSLIEKSYTNLVAFLNNFGIFDIRYIQENRIDYAYHTNLIQNPTKYFNDTNLLKTLKTSFKKYSKVGDIGREITIDYFSLGMRKSNCVFFRTYNKTKEVIEMNYKGYFIDIWYNSGLINAHDKYCLEYAYKKGSFNELITGRCLWYLEFGKNLSLKEELEVLINECTINSDNYEHLEKKIKGVLPDVTIILNFEFETKRKFYASFDNLINEFFSSKGNDLTNRLHRILDNRKVILDYLTSKMVYFDSSFWKKIQSVKIISGSDQRLVREYSNQLNLEKVELNILKSLASRSIYENLTDDSFLEDDINDLINNINDNTFINYHNIKNKKYKSIKSLIENIK